MDLSDATHDASGTRAALELRVLSGRQKGARALLASDGAWTSLGRHEGNDLVLREAPFDQVEVSLQDGQWWWREGEAEALALQAGQGVRFGDFMLLLCSPSAPWGTQDPQEWAIDRRADGSDASETPTEFTDAAPSAEPGTEASGLPDASYDSKVEAARSPDAGDAAARSSADAATPTATDEPSSEPAAAPATATGILTRGWLRNTTAGRLTAAGGATALAAAVWLILPLGQSVDTGAKPPVQAAENAAAVATTPFAAPAVVPAEADLEKLQALLNGQPAPSKSLKASLGPDGRLVLQGLVADDETLETLLRPVIREGLRVSLRVLTQAELDTRLLSLNKALSPDGARVRAMADGRIMLLGEVADEAVITSLTATVMQEIPEALGLEVAAVTKAVIRQQAEAAQVAEATNRPKPPPMPPLPEVISVIGGDEAYIVLADGTRVGPGGQAGAWRVSAIRSGGVTFVDGLGRSRGVQP